MNLDDLHNEWDVDTDINPGDLTEEARKYQSYTPNTIGIMDNMKKKVE